MKTIYQKESVTLGVNILVKRKLYIYFLRLRLTLSLIRSRTLYLVFISASSVPICLLLVPLTNLPVYFAKYLIFFSVVIMTGLLGLLNWKVTVISSNFIALMLILTMAMNIHMSTRFIQLRKNNLNLSNFEILSKTTHKMFWPILYTVLTTVCAFLSLIFSEIKPIIDFGWMMTLGLMTSFLITFTLLPTLLSFAPVNNVNLEEINNYKITNLFSKISINNKNLIFIIIDGV